MRPHAFLAHVAVEERRFPRPKLILDALLALMVVVVLVAVAVY